MKHDDEGPQPSKSMNEREREDQMRYQAERMQEIADKRDELTDEFLLEVLPRRGHGETVLQAFDAWTKGKWPYVELSVAERGMLLHYVTHTPSGKTRILLAGHGKPDKFTECREDARVDMSALDRMKEGGDLAKREDETGLEYVERITPFVVKEAAEPPAPVVEEEQARLPYADDQDAMFDGEIME